MAILRGLQTKFLKHNFPYVNEDMKRSERQQGQDLDMYVSVHKGNCKIMRAGIKRKSNVKGEEKMCVRECVCERELQREGERNEVLGD